MAPVAKELQSNIAKASPITSKFRWFFTGETKKRSALEALSHLRAMTEDSKTLELAAAAKSAWVVDEAQDFDSR